MKATQEQTEKLRAIGFVWNETDKEFQHIDKGASWAVFPTSYETEWQERVEVATDDYETGFDYETFKTFESLFAYLAVD